MPRGFLVKRSKKSTPVSYRVRGGEDAAALACAPVLPPAPPGPRAAHFGNPEAAHPAPLYSPTRPVSREHEKHKYFERSFNLGSPVSAESFPTPAALLAGGGGGANGAGGGGTCGGDALLFAPAELKMGTTFSAERQKAQGHPQAALRGRGDHVAGTGAQDQGRPGGGAAGPRGGRNPAAGRVHLPTVQGGVRRPVRAGAAQVLAHRARGVPLPRVRQGLQLPGQPGLAPPLAQTTARTCRGPCARARSRHQRQRSGHAEPWRCIRVRLRGRALRVPPLRQEVPSPGLSAQAPAGTSSGRGRRRGGRRTGPECGRRVPPVPSVRGDLPQQGRPGAPPASVARCPGVPLQVLPGHLLQLPGSYAAHQQVPPV
ncbi:Insulinoma-associated protein 1 [Lemmus lemmus]